MTWFAVPNALREALLESTEIAEATGGRVHYQELPQDSAYPHVWFTRSSRDSTKCIDGSEEMTIERFAFEIVSDRDAGELIDKLVETLEAIEGDAGGRDIQLVEVEDADDDYVFQSVGEGEPDYLHALNVAVYGVKQLG